MQSFYAVQSQEYADQMRGAMAQELRGLRSVEQQVQIQMGINEQQCAYEVNSARVAARHELNEAVAQNSRIMREVTRLELQERDAAQQSLIHRQRLWALESDQSRMARQTSDTESAGREALIAELEREGRAMAAHELFWYAQAEEHQAAASREYIAVLL